MGQETGAHRMQDTEVRGSLSTRTSELTPFLKWPGGKRWLTQAHSHLLAVPYRRYIEPFLGSGSVFFALAPADAILSDANAELIDTYRAIRSRPHVLRQCLEAHATAHSDEYYYKVRASQPSGLVERAARMIYLNRTCFNGIYRVNLSGMFNVPRGTKDSVILETDDFPQLSKALKGAELRCGDFEAVIDEARRGDLVFADPPYTVRHNTNGFVKYNEKLFSWDDQERLAATLARAFKRGATIVATNANHASVRDLYTKHGFQHFPVSRFSSMSSKGSTRGQYEELVIAT